MAYTIQLSNERGLGILAPLKPRGFVRVAATSMGFALLSGAMNAQVLPGEEALQVQYAPSAYTAGNAVTDLVSGDIDHDGDVDVLSADGTAGVIRVLVNAGALGFFPRTINTGVTPSVLAIGDLDSDGYPDLVVGFNSGMRWMRNDGAGNYSVAATYLFPAGDTDPVAARLADVNEDGNLDAVIGLNSHQGVGGAVGGLWIALGDGAGGFQPLATQDLALRAANITIADFNGDSHLDVAELSGQPFVSSAVTIVFGLGDGSFANAGPGFGAGIYAHGLASGDFDGDGDVDIATGFKYWVSVRMNDGNGNFTLAQSVGVGSYVKGITVGDIDRDGDLDIVATSGTAKSLRLMANDTTGHFTYFGQVPVSIQCFSVLLADTNNDGYLDAWAGDAYTGELFSGASHRIVARYGKGKLNSLGVLPAMTATGVPSISGEGFIPEGTRLLPLQPAVFVVGTDASVRPALGGLLLVQEPWFLVSTTTSAGSGNPSQSDGTVTLPVGADQLGGAGVGTKFFIQVLALDPLQVDGTLASLSDGLWFEIVL